MAVLGLVFAALLPGGSHTLSWPALFAALGWLVSTRLRGTGWRAVALTLGLAPAAVLLGATAVVTMDVGLAIGGMIAAPHFAMLLMLLLPLVQPVLPPDEPKPAPG